MKIAALFLCLLLGHATNTNLAYIHDLEGLLNSVESRDSSRPQLTLKLADALFNEALTLAGSPTPTEKETHAIAAYRRKSLGLYQEALSGLKGQFPAPTGSAKAKIQFQMARLHSDLGETASAQQIWQELANQDAIPDMQRESLLRLAELLENRTSAADLTRAEGYYRKALGLCSSQDVCSYAHYRLAWVYHRQDRTSEAITEIEQALWDSKGQVREEALRDMLGFIGGAGDDGQDSLAKIEKLSAKLKRPGLVQELADAYFAHGNRKAGVHVLEAANRKSPTLKGYVRLMEEDYGFRNWQNFNTSLDAAQDLVAHGATVNNDTESEKILRRLTVQLDGERATQPTSVEPFKKSVMLYMALFPKSNQRNQMIDGWLASESDDAVKIKQLQAWISEEAARKEPKEEVRLRKIRAALAQKTGDYPVVIAEMQALLPFAEGNTAKRETAYQIAYAEYQAKDYTSALPKFQDIARIPSGTYTPDKWAILSENLALDILAQKKDYAAVSEQAAQWTEDSRFNSWMREKKDELQDIKKIETSARFEWATAQGNVPQALDVFSKDCFANVLLPQSCGNAQVLAVKLGDQKTLIEILKKLGKKDELAAELEASAEFSEAAKMQEPKLKEKTAETRDFLKVALLYELGASTVNRDRVLHELIVKLNKTKTLGAEEDLLLQTFKDADLLNAQILRLPWKKENREYLQDYLVSNGRGNAEIQAQLTKSCQDSGPGWQNLALTELRRLDDKQRAIHFAGKGSKAKFQARVAALKTLTERGNCYLQATSARERVIFATLMAHSENELAEEIKSSPIPAGVDEEGKASLEKALLEMAQPFTDKSEEFSKLATAQLEKVEDAQEREDLRAKLEANDAGLFAVHANTKHETPKVTDPQSSEVLKAAIDDLHKNPNQRESLAQLKSYFEANGNPRLAAYFQGRLLQLGEEVKQ